MQVSSLIYAMGPAAEHIFKTFDFDDPEHAQTFDVVLAKFDAYFMRKRTPTHDRGQFHKRDQLPSESVEEYVRCLYEMAELCDWEGDKKPQEIKDRLVVGVLDKDLSEKLQLMDLEGTPLEKVIQLCRQNELVKKQLKLQTEQAAAPTSQQLEEVSCRGGGRGRRNYHRQGQGQG